MSVSGEWDLFVQHWPISVTMAFGSFIAGATAEGGGAVAFPVFTKLLAIPPADARTFSLGIQSVGMIAAALVIYGRRIRVLPRVILWVSVAGVPGQILGTWFLQLPAPYPRILFTFVAGTFGIALIASRWFTNYRSPKHMPTWGTREIVLFTTAGLLGGVVAANVGSGIDMLTFVLLTLLYGVDEKVSTPTTVVIMGINSVVGFSLHAGVVQDVGVVWEYLLVAMPIVVFGAPLGAYVAASRSRDEIIVFLLLLIAVEVITTAVLVPFDPTSLGITATAVIISGALFALMLWYRTTTHSLPSSRPSRREPDTRP